MVSSSASAVGMLRIPTGIISSIINGFGEIGVGVHANGYAYNNDGIYTSYDIYFSP